MQNLQSIVFIWTLTYRDISVPLMRKIRLISKFMTSQPEKQTIVIHHGTIMQTQ